MLAKLVSTHLLSPNTSLLFGCRATQLHMEYCLYTGRAPEQMAPVVLEWQEHVAGCHQCMGRSGFGAVGTVQIMAGVAQALQLLS